MTTTADSTDPQVQRAFAFAKRAHEGQIDKVGDPYIGHPMRVASSVTGVDEKIVAALHDVVEDCDVTLDDLRSEGYSEEIVAAVDALSKREGESLEESIARVVVNALATTVKYADVADNSNPERTAKLDPDTRERLAAKYARTITLLDAGASAN
jgi:(p)ppGpp synthase/HD superfamily hydrolase